MDVSEDSPVSVSSNIRRSSSSKTSSDSSINGRSSSTIPVSDGVSSETGEDFTESSSMVISLSPRTGASNC